MPQIVWQLYFSSCLSGPLLAFFAKRIRDCDEFSSNCRDYNLVWFSGTTCGLGAQVPVSGNIDRRFEVIHDQVDSYAYGYKWDNTALRAARRFPVLTCLKAFSPLI